MKLVMDDKTCSVQGTQAEILNGVTNLLVHMYDDKMITKKDLEHMIYIVCADSDKDREDRFKKLKKQIANEFKDMIDAIMDDEYISEEDM